VWSSVKYSSHQLDSVVEQLHRLTPISGNKKKKSDESTNSPEQQAMDQDKSSEQQNMLYILVTGANR
jgi:hypothetical protein